MGGIVRLRPVLLVALVGAMLGAPGCASVGSYFEHRYRDLTRTFDIGLTFSKKPQIGLYWNTGEVLTAGYSHMDGYLFGLGGGQLGWTREYHHCWAVLYGQETIGWGPLLDTDRRNEVIVRRRSNVLGIATSIIGWDPTGDGYGDGPDYTPSCGHFIHLAYIGIEANFRYTEIAQFFLGWFGLDISGHDGDRYPVGKWSFPYRKEPKPAPEVAPETKSGAPSDER